MNLENDIIGKYVEKLMGIEKKEESKLEHEKKNRNYNGVSGRIWILNI